MRLLVKLIVIVAAGVGLQKAIDAKVPYEAWFTLRTGLAGLVGDEAAAQALAIEYTDHLPFRTDPVAAKAAREFYQERLRLEALGLTDDAGWDADVETISTDAHDWVMHCPDLAEHGPLSAATP